MDDLALAAKVRSLQILQATTRAGMACVSAAEIHFIAYLAEALSPTWGSNGQTLVMMKTGNGPFFRDLQQALDHLVVSGLLSVSGFGYTDSEAGWRLSASYGLINDRTAEILAHLEQFDEEVKFGDLLLEIALGLAGTNDVQALIRGDVLYGDRRVSNGRLIEFRPESGKNVAANVADYFSFTMPDGRNASAGEKINLYMALLRKRALGAA
jgi:hypothetical protein